ncbi:MAG: TfoX/Sxy family protein [Xanthobacteraceae bacterium]
MDRDFLLDLFAAFGPVTLRRMFSGYGVSRDGINFALVLRGAVYLRADERTVPRFEAEGVKPFQYTARGKIITLGSYWRLPERLYDDPDELAVWASDAFDAARQAAALKTARKSGKRRAFSSEVKSGSREENASKQKRGRKAVKRGTPKTKAKRQAI